VPDVCTHTESLSAEVVVGLSADPEVIAGSRFDNYRVLDVVNGVGEWRGHARRVDVRLLQPASAGRGGVRDDAPRAGTQRRLRGVNHYVGRCQHHRRPLHEQRNRGEQREGRNQLEGSSGHKNS
jgi:hypothetical protein